MLMQIDVFLPAGIACGALRCHRDFIVRKQKQEKKWKTCVLGRAEGHDDPTVPGSTEALGAQHKHSQGKAGEHVQEMVFLLASNWNLT